MNESSKDEFVYDEDWFFSLPIIERRTYHRGWEAYYNRLLDGKKIICWMDTHENIYDFPRPCKVCKKFNIEDGRESYDACIGKLPGVVAACCGHGTKDGYIYFDNDVVIRFPSISIDRSLKSLLAK